MTWAMITGEYPPAPGGVSDYTRLVAQALVSAGDDVHVWAPAVHEAHREDAGVHVHRLARGFDACGLMQLDRQIRRLPASRRILVQYVPHAYGFKGLNLPFCAWLASRRAGNIDIIFHEVAYPWLPNGTFKEYVLAGGQSLMAALAVRAAERIFVPCQAWERTLRDLGARDVLWSPIPSNLPDTVDLGQVQQIRRQFRRDRRSVLIGHFGTYSRLITPMLLSILRSAMERTPCTFLLLGYGARDFLEEAQLSSEHKSRIYAMGMLQPQELAENIAACDLLVQPYPDGITARRTSALAPLALGVPVVTNEGRHSEPLWRQSGCVAIGSTAEQCALQIERLVADVSLRQELGRLGRSTYLEQFALEHTVRRLRASG